MTIAEEKAELRTFVRLTRSARDFDDLANAEIGFDDLLNILSDQFSWRRIAAFTPTPSEPPIASGLDRLVASGVEVVVPVSSDDGLLEWIELTPRAIFTTESDSMRMPIPTVGDRVPVGNLDAVLVPAAAVDREGNRLGWGKGFYDRFLATVSGSPLVIAVVFDSDVVLSVPSEPHDRPVGAILTESEITFTQ
jgi:5-formyltetrahydrofolate cyclo-ligase